MTQPAFNTRPWDERTAYLGTTAEQAFETVAAHLGIALERLGMDRESPLKYNALHPFLRQRPDYVAQTSNDGPFFVEVKGSGSDGVVKIKLDSIETAQHWQLLHRVKFFVFDSARKLYATMWLDDLRATIKRDKIVAACFSDGNQYHPVPRTLFKWHRLPAMSEAQQAAA
ncbi:hypothetical protein [Geobacter pickeringii]|uniref:Uncharacterized protein n=1 Tax=Geobacter pickeringii TaxID=345632 RepID=A0A0B5BDW8_9BACT|nr:hypothetical protein [Geobacter pickeringii]AJE04672.1 hypothetical protein GPICK_16005 [Geobacter pickeringii]